jgi:hypothetical protein
MKRKNNLGKTVSNQDELVDPTFSGDLVPISDNTSNIGTSTKRLKSMYVSNLIGALINYASIILSGTSNQIQLGTGTTTTISAPTPGQNQVISVPNAGTTSTKFIIQDSASQQNINSNINLASNLLVTPTSTFMKKGLLQVEPDANSKSVVQVLGWGPGANACEFNAGNIALLANSKAPAQYMTDDIDGDTIIASSANSSLYPSAAIRMGFTGSPTALSITRSAITLTPPQVNNLSSVSLSGTSNASFSVRSFLTGFVGTAGTFLSDSAVSDCIIRNGVSSAALRIGFGTGSTSSVVINSTSSSFAGPVSVNTSSAPRGSGLDTGSTVAERKVIVYQASGTNNDHQYTGFGVRTGQFVFKTLATADFVFENGTSASASTEAARITSAGNMILKGTSLQVGNAILSTGAGAARGYNFPESYQSCSVITNSIITGLTNTSARPAIAANSTPQPYEIRAFSTTSLGNDDGFLRLRGGGSSFIASASWIDISGSSTIPDMNRNIVLGAAGSERVRIDGTGLTIASGNNLNLPDTTGTLTWTHTVAAGSFTTSYNYFKMGNLVTLVIGENPTGATFASAGYITATLPTAIRPDSAKACGMGMIININGVRTHVRATILGATTKITITGSLNDANLPSGQVIAIPSEIVIQYLLV